MISQRSPEWFAKRAGAFTASRAGDLMARIKNGPSASRRTLITTLAIERITGACVETYSNAAMQRGIDLEAEAIDAYSFDRCVTVQECAYLDHPRLSRVGCSPDGLIDAFGMLEVKCPANPAKHLDALETGAHAQEYKWQLQHQLFVSGREWVDAVSYDPRFPAGLQLAIVRVDRDREAIKALEDEICAAEEEIEDIVARLREKMERDAA